MRKFFKMQGTGWSETALKAAFYVSVLSSVIFLILPVLIIIPMSLNEGQYLAFPPERLSLLWYAEFFRSLDWRNSVLTSIQVAVLATSLSLGLGLPAAYSIIRGKPRMSSALLAVFAVPIVFPVIVSAVALQYFLSPLGMVGTRLGLAIAHTVLALPFVVLPTIAALRRIDVRLEWQALSLGATRLRTFFTVTVPLLKPALIAVMVFAFITSFDEIVLALFLSAGRTQTLPKRIWEGLRFELHPTVAVVSSILLVLSLVAVVSILALSRAYSRSNQSDLKVTRSEDY